MSSPKPPKPPKPPDPVVMPDPEDPLKKLESRKKLISASARSGRASTMLSGEDSYANTTTGY